MYTLAFDTAANSVSVAILKDRKILTEVYREMERGQGEALFPMIQDIIEGNELSPADIGRVAVAIGPGSFTGVRVGLSAARGIGLALAVPVLGVTTLEAAAYRITGRVMAVADTKRGDFFTQFFRDGQPMEDPCIRTVKQLACMPNLRITGSGSVLLSQQITCQTVDNDLIPAVAVALRSLEEAHDPEPLYLRDADVSC